MAKPQKVMEDFELAKAFLKEAIRRKRFLYACRSGVNLIKKRKAYLTYTKG